MADETPSTRSRGSITHHSLQVRSECRFQHIAQATDHASREEFVVCLGQVAYQFHEFPYGKILPIGKLVGDIDIEGDLKGKERIQPAYIIELFSDDVVKQSLRCKMPFARGI